MGREVRLDTAARRRLVQQDLIDGFSKIFRLYPREVKLTGKWWMRDNGPLLAFVKDDGRPLALVPMPGGTYKAVDPGMQAEWMIDADPAERIADQAVMFFRLLDDGPIDLKALIRFGLHGNRKEVMRIVQCGLAGGALSMLVPVAVSALFDHVVPSAAPGLLLQLVAILLVVAGASFLFDLTRSFTLLRVEGKMDISVNVGIMERLFKLPAPFFRQYTSGDLTQRAFGFDNILRSLTSSAQAAIISGIFSLFSFFYLFFVDVRLALLAMLLVGVAVAFTTAANLERLTHERALFKWQGALSSRVFQLLKGVAKLRVAAAETRAFAVWGRDFAHKKRLGLVSKSLANRVTVFNAGYPLFASLVLFAAVDLFRIDIQVGAFLSFSAAFAQFLSAALGIGAALTGLLTVVPLYERLTPILTSRPEVDEAKDSPGELTGEIEISRVSFRYSPESPLILKDVSLTIRPGEFVAFVGPSGSGKSTLLRLLLGFEHPSSGAIYYSGKDISGLDLNALRRRIGVVLQDGRLMTGDIFSNIVGSASLGAEAAWEAARMAGLEEDIKRFPMGMHTVISDGGSTLSGGQRQRLLIARALVRKPRILFFDEATSALDNRTQELVSESIEQLKATRIVIAHRLSTIKNCDRIYVLDNGGIVEHGSFEDLMRLNGKFSELAKRQMA
ncbi:MAG TPA: NHLP bacteriocin export ABC transporter permease/ATPase subunit [Paucimonas sp.]|nr:NHLP bacteriocin export ABC transporter permease/ATPase subunit [Paucimonas sp.]